MDIPLITHTAGIQEYLQKVPNGETIGVTAPLETRDSIITCLYTESLGSVLVHTDYLWAKKVSKVIYEPKEKLIAVHGIKAVWRDRKITVPKFNHNKLWCTRLMSYLLHPEWEEYQYYLGYLSEYYLSEKYPYTPAKVYGVPYPDAFYELLIHDAVLIRKLAIKLNMEMDEALWKLYHEIDLPTAVILNEMTQSKGLRVDRFACLVELERVEKEKDELEKLMFGKEPMKLYTEHQVYQYLSRRIAIPNAYAVHTQEIRGDMLDELAFDHQEAAWVSRWRELDTGIRFLRTALNPEQEGRISSVWKQTTAKTGRIIARDFAVQNIKREYRNLLNPDDGFILIKADYSQSQLRILAHLSNDEELIKAFQDGLDLHFETGLKHYPLSHKQAINEDTKRDIRNLGKDINFSICFGGTAKGLAGTINKKRTDKEERIDVETARKYIDEWNSRFPKAIQFFKQRWDELKPSDGAPRIERSPFGRTREFTRHSSAIQRQHRAQVLQSFEADILKTAMVAIDGIFKKELMKSRIVLTIHDSLWVQAPIGEADAAINIVQKRMTEAFPLRVPLKVDVQVKTPPDPPTLGIGNIFQ